MVDFSNNDEHGGGNVTQVNFHWFSEELNRQGPHPRSKKEKDEFRGTRVSKTRISRGISMQDCKEMYEKM